MEQGKRSKLVRDDLIDRSLREGRKLEDVNDLLSRSGRWCSSGLATDQTASLRVGGDLIDGDPLEFYLCTVN